MDQLLGAASALVLILAYLVIVESLMAVVTLLAQYIAIQVGKLRHIAASRPRAPVSEEPTYRLGGGLMKWE